MCVSIQGINPLLIVVLPILTDALNRIWGALPGTSRVILVLVKTNRKEALDIFELGLRKGRTDISLSSWGSGKETQEKLGHHLYKVGKENGIRKKKRMEYIYSASCVHILYLAILKKAFLSSVGVPVWKANNKGNKSQPHLILKS